MGFQINVSEPYIPAGSGFTHESTTYVISKNKEMTDVFIDYTTTNPVEMLLYNNEMSMTRYDLFYYKVIINLSNGDNLESNIDTILYNKVNDIQVSTIFTPGISIDSSTLDVGNTHVKVSASEFKLVYGSEVHSSTDWSVKNTSGIVLWERNFDVDNLTEIMIPKNIFSGHNVYVIEVRFRAVGDESFDGRLIVANDFFDAKMSLVKNTELFINTMNAIRVNMSIVSTTRLTWSLRDKENNYLYKDISATVFSVYENYCIINIDGNPLEAGKSYLLDLNTYDYSENLIKVTIELSTIEHTTISDRFILDIKHNELNLIKNIKHNGPLVCGMVKEYTNNRAQFDVNRVSYVYDLLTNKFEYVDMLSSTRTSAQVDNLYFVQGETQYNNISSINVTEKIGGTDGVNQKMYNRNIKITNDHLHSLVERDMDVLIENDVDSFIGHGSFHDNEILFIGRNDSVENLYLQTSDTGLVNVEINGELTIPDLKQYYNPTMDYDYLILNTLKRKIQNDFIVERNGVYCRIDNDNNVFSKTHSGFITNKRSFLYENINNTIYNFKEMDNGKLTIIEMNGETLDMLRILNTDLVFKDLLFIETLKHNIVILNYTLSGHDVYLFN